jgi:hypothetical protein
MTGDEEKRPGDHEQPIDGPSQDSQRQPGEDDEERLYDMPVDEEEADGVGPMPLELEAHEGEAETSEPHATSSPVSETPRGVAPKDDDEPASPHDLDVCPNCGAPMRTGDTLVCMRCGFDLKTMTVVKTKTGEVEAKPEAEPADPLVKRHAMEPWLPISLAGVAALILLIGYLVGATGLFPAVQAEATAEVAGEPPLPVTIGLADRMLGVARFPVRLGLWTLCGLGAVAAAAWVFGRPVGDVALAFWRMLAAVAVARLAGFVDLTSKPLEWFVEAVIQAGAFFLLVMGLFRFRPRNAGTIVGLTIVVFAILYGIARLVTWAT